MTYSVRLDVFEGPLDLLLHLVSKDRLDVADVSISTITDDYLQAVKKMEDMDLEVATSFLVLAATLLELKSIKLLPKRSYDDPEVAALLEERDYLLHRLIEYSTFKGAAQVIARGLEDNRDYFVRIADVPPELVPSAPDILEGVDAERLAAAAAKALEPKPVAVVDTFHIAPIRVNVRETIDIIAEQLRLKPTSSFRELCKEAHQRIEVIVRFLALLELFRMNSVDLEQLSPFGDIVVRWRQPNIGTSQ